MKWRWNWPSWWSCTESWRPEVHPAVRWPIRAPFRMPLRTHSHLHRHSRPADAFRTLAAAINTFNLIQSSARFTQLAARFEFFPKKVKSGNGATPCPTFRPHGIPCCVIVEKSNRPLRTFHTLHQQTKTRQNHVDTHKKFNDVTRQKRAFFQHTHTHTH